MSKREAILLVRLDGIGDAALCVPALEGMRRAFPDAVFGAICSPANAALFSERVAHIHVYDGTALATTMRDELVDERYTRVLIATEEVVGYQLGRLAGAQSRAGFWHGIQKPFKSLWQRRQVTEAVYRPAAWTKKPEHEVRTLYRLAEALGATQPVPREPLDLRTWLHIESCEGALTAAGALAFQITPKLLTARWSPTALAQLVCVALERSGCERAVLVASAQDESLACSIFEHTPPAMRAAGRVGLVPPLPLPQWLSVLARAAALVTPDTGAAHVAGMLGVGVVDLFDEAGFEQLSQQWHPWAGVSRCLVKPAWRPGFETTLGREVGDAVRAVTAT